MLPSVTNGRRRSDRGHGAEKVDSRRSRVALFSSIGSVRSQELQAKLMKLILQLSSQLYHIRRDPRTATATPGSSSLGPPFLLASRLPSDHEIVVLGPCRSGNQLFPGLHRRGGIHQLDASDHPSSDWLGCHGDQA